MLKKVPVLWEILGGATEALKLYQNFRDPQRSLGKKQYLFMATGPISPLLFSGTPLFFTALNYKFGNLVLLKFQDVNSVLTFKLNSLN